MIRQLENSMAVRRKGEENDLVFLSATRLKILMNESFEKKCGDSQVRVRWDYLDLFCVWHLQCYGEGTGLDTYFCTCHG